MTFMNLFSELKIPIALLKKEGSLSDSSVTPPNISYQLKQICLGMAMKNVFKFLMYFQSSYQMHSI